MNRSVITDQYYMQYGRAVNTQSQYPGVFAGQPYFIVIINHWPDVVRASDALAKTDYYSHWPQTHFDAIVTRRNRALQHITRN